jgi:hypothetical protein
MLLVQHVEIPIPKPKKNELLVKIEASSINPGDWKIQQGMLRPILPFKFPFTPGKQISSTASLMWFGTEIQIDHLFACMFSSSFFFRFSEIQKDLFCHLSFPLHLVSKYQVRYQSCGFLQKYK